MEDRARCKQGVFRRVNRIVGKLAGKLEDELRAWSAS